MAWCTFFTWFEASSKPLRPTRPQTVGPSSCWWLVEPPRGPPGWRHVGMPCESSPWQSCHPHPHAMCYLLRMPKGRRQHHSQRPRVWQMKNVEDSCGAAVTIFTNMVQHGATSIHQFASVNLLNDWWSMTSMLVTSCLSRPREHHKPQGPQMPKPKHREQHQWWLMVVNWLLIDADL